VLRNLRVRNVGSAIFLHGSTSCRVEGCFVSSTFDHGIFVLGGSANEIVGNAVSDVGANGISLEAANHNVVRDNKVTGGAFGLIIDGSNNVVEQNVVEGSSSHGINLSESSSTLASDNTVVDAGETGIRVFGNDNALVGNAIVRPAADGISLDGIENFVHGNRVQQAGAPASGGDAIEVFGAANDVSWNRLTGPHAQHGLHVTTGGDAGRYHANEITKAGSNGIQLAADGCLVSLNKARKSANFDLFDAGGNNIHVGNDVKTSNLP
jgi:parallel beta-helix repeat protein